MKVNVIGAGLAGSEAAWQLLKRGCEVALYEMKPQEVHPCAPHARLCGAGLLQLPAVGPARERGRPAQGGEAARGLAHHGLRGGRARARGRRHGRGPGDVQRRRDRGPAQPPALHGRGGRGHRPAGGGRPSSPPAPSPATPLRRRSSPSPGRRGSPSTMPPRPSSPWNPWTWTGPSAPPAMAGARTTTSTAP